MSNTPASGRGADIDVQRLLDGVDLAEVAGRYVQLKKVGSEWLGLCPVHEEKTPSFRVIPAKGFCYCHGCGWGGDAIKLIRAMTGCDFREACERLGARDLGGAAKPKPRPQAEPERVTSKPPADAGVPDMRTRGFGEPVTVWTYRDAAGDVLGYVARYEYEQDGPDGIARRKKLTPQWTWGRKGNAAPGWGMGHWNKPRPLYGLDRLAARPAHPVLVVEGEKAADAGGELLPGQVVITWPGGSQAVKHADWTPLAGRDVVLWPDCDDVGRAAMTEVASILHGLGCRIRTVAVRDQADGWDLADALAERWTTSRVQVYARERIVEWVPPEMPAETGTPKPSTGAASGPIEQAQTATPDPVDDDLPPRFDNPIPPAPDDGEAWDEPADLFKSMAVPRIDPEWLPSGLAPYVFDQAELIGTDAEIVALSCILACAGAADDRIQIQPARNNPSWLESPRLWGAIVGEPSVKKSPAISRAVSRLRKLDIELGEKAASILAEQAIKEKVYDKQVKEYTDKAAKGEDAGPMPAKPAQPTIERLIVEDITVEALSEILKANPRGVMCMADELSGWFGAMDAYNGNKSGAKDRSHWLEIYNGGPRKIDRIGRGSIIVPNWSACMLGGIQPDSMRKIAASMPSDGLMQRFMVVIGQSVRPGVDRVPDLQAQDAYRGLLEQLFSIQPHHEPIRLSVEAKAAHDEIVAFAHQMIGLRVLPAGLSSHLGKWEGLAPRLMLVFHLIEAAYAHQYPAREVPGETAWRVRNFMVRFLFRHALAFYADILGDNGYAEAVRWIGGYILAKGCQELTNRDLLRDYSWWKQAKDWERATVMQRLVDFGWLQPKRGRRDAFRDMPTALAVNPAVQRVFAERAEQERSRRKAVREMMREAWGGGAE